MSKPEFVYTTYIRTTPQKVWDAITTTEFTRQYWKIDMNSDWKPGSKWSSTFVGSGFMPDGTPAIQGEVVESVPPKRLVLTWFKPENPADKSRASFDIEMVDQMTRLTVTHDQMSEETASKVSGGWPRVLASLKTLLETGSALDTWAGLAACSEEKKAVSAR